MSEIDRREILGALMVATPAVLSVLVEGRAHGAPATEGAPERKPPLVAGGGSSSVFAGKHAVAPLTFDPRKLKGISERMIVSHHDNNYASAVKNLNKVEEQLAATTKDTPPFLLSGLKERELTFTNSRILHEHYFGNLGGGGGKPGGTVEKRLSVAYGGVARWEEHFRAVGASLGGGSGWTVLSYNFHTGDVRTYWSSNHTQAVAMGAPLLVMDMYEHAYAIDYGSAAAKYIDAFFDNIHWDEVNRRLERAEKAATLLRS